MRSEYSTYLINHGSSQIASDPQKAISMITKGICLDPTNGIAYFNLGLALHCTKKIDEAIKAYQLGLEQENAPRDHIINNLSQDLLLQGKFESGFELYQSRLIKMKHDFEIYERLFGFEWEGFDDKRMCSKLILVAEQGFGDSFQFSRFIKAIASAGIETEFFCQEAVYNVFNEFTNFGKISRSLSEQYKPDVRWCSLMSLPKLLKIQAEQLPYFHGYIKPTYKYVKKWRSILKKDPSKKLLIAIHWQGNPSFEKKIYSKGRSMEAALFNKFQSIENIEFISIQKGSAATDRKKINKIQFVEGQEIFDKSFDFRDTAGVLSNCDLLISSDSSVVHLAGSMGMHVWVALSYVPEWRWGLNGEKSNWYNNMSLYRQQSRGDWNSLFDKMIIDLNNLLI